MNFIRLFIFSLLVFGISFTINAQFYNTGQERTSTRWKQIDTEHFRLVYPDFAEKKAQYFAQRLKWAAENVPTNMGKKIRKIDIIMHFESATSNGMVIWAPKRMEVHSTPDQNSYSEDWFEQLAVHEYRHVVQIDHLNQGLTKIISLVFGQAGTSVVLGAYLPLWYLEGDAVTTETALTETGRGRMSDFAMPLKAQLTEYGSYSYDKATMGSYKDFVPDHYILGYHLVSMGATIYGSDLWKNTEDFVARNPYYVVPFSHAIYKQSGLRKKSFYNSCMTELTNKWKPQTTNFKADTLTKTDNRFFTSYRFGQMLNDRILVALKTGIAENGKFVIININTHKEYKLFTTGYSYFDNVDLCDSILLWTERRYHPRWEQVKYQVVMKYDFRTHKKTQISHRTNYTFVVKNPAKNEIACINNSISGENSIVFISLETNKITKEIAIKEQIKNLEFSDDGKYIYFYKLGKGGFGLFKLNISNELITQILNPSFKNRNFINIMDSSLLYISDKNGSSNIFELNLKNKSTRQITDVNYGIGAISNYKNKILFDNYSASGWQTNSFGKNSIQTFETTQFKPTYYKSYITDSSRNIQTQELDTQYFETKKYNKFTHLLNIHSWGPVAIHASSQNVNPGISIMSQNLMSNLDLNIGYEYVLSEAVNRYYAEVNYSALYPKISLVSSYQDRRGSYNTNTGIEYYTWNETNLGMQISQGIVLNKGAYSNYIRPLFGYNFLKIGKNDDTPYGLPIGKNIQSLRYDLYASTYRKRSSLDINPRLGQNINLDIRHTPFGDISYGYIVAFESNTYLLGIGKHHNMKLYFGYQEKEHYSSYAYSDIINLPRGYINIYNNVNTNTRNIKLFSYQFNYQFPLLYPDLSISSLAYIKRIKVNLFADYLKSDDLLIEKSYLDFEKFEYSSFGADLTFDMHILRLIAPLDLGLRSGYMPSSKSYFFQFLFSVNM